MLQICEHEMDGSVVEIIQWMKIVVLVIDDQHVTQALIRDLVNIELVRYQVLIIRMRIHINVIQKIVQQHVLHDKFGYDKLVDVFLKVL